jgi:hypothetical protein
MAHPAHPAAYCTASVARDVMLLIIHTRLLGLLQLHGYTDWKKGDALHLYCCILACTLNCQHIPVHLLLFVSAYDIESLLPQERWYVS